MALCLKKRKKNKAVVFSFWNQVSIFHSSLGMYFLLSLFAVKSLSWGRRCSMFMCPGSWTGHTCVQSQPGKIKQALFPTLMIQSIKLVRIILAAAPIWVEATLVCNPAHSFIELPWQVNCLMSIPADVVAACFDSSILAVQPIWKPD